MRPHRLLSTTQPYERISGEGGEREGNDHTFSLEEDCVGRRNSILVVREDSRIRQEDVSKKDCNKVNDKEGCDPVLPLYGGKKTRNAGFADSVGQQGPGEHRRDRRGAPVVTHKCVDTSTEQCGKGTVERRGRISATKPR